MCDMSTVEHLFAGKAGADCHHQRNGPGVLETPEARTTRLNGVIMDDPYLTPTPRDTLAPTGPCTLEGCTRARVTARHCQHHAQQLWRNTHLIQRCPASPAERIGDLLDDTLAQIAHNNRRAA